MKPSPQGMAYGFGTVVIWAAAFPAIRAALPFFSPMEISLLRSATAWMCMLLFVKLWLPSSTTSWKDRLLTTLTGAIVFTGYNIGLNTSEQWLSPDVASFLACQIPVVTTLLAVGILKEHMGRQGWLGLALSVLGVSYMAWHQPNDALHHASNHTLWGVGLMLSAVVLASSYTIFQKYMLKRMDAVELSFWALLGATLGSFSGWPHLLPHWQAAPESVQFALLFLGIFSSAIAFFLWAKTLSLLHATQATSFLYLMPFLTIIMAWVWLHDTPSPHELLGGVLGLAGAWCVQRDQSIRAL